MAAPGLRWYLSSEIVWVISTRCQQKMFQSKATWPVRGCKIKPFKEEIFVWEPDRNNIALPCKEIVRQNIG